MAPGNNPQDLADFFSALATRYQGRIRAYEVWNEPNLAREWGDRLPDPTQYADLMKRCYTSIKAADPNAMVISAGLFTNRDMERGVAARRLVS